jgi:hypothetical protein
MKKIKKMLLLGIILFCLLIIFLTCSKKSCPTYVGRNTNGQYSNIKLQKK